MQFGVGPFTGQRPAFDDRSMADIYDDMLALAAVADDVGLDSVWVSEHHFVDDGYMSGTLPMLSAIAAVTEKIAVGTSASVAPLHRPLRLAEDAATVDLISGGRLLFGTAVGYREEEFEAFGVDLSDRANRIETAIRVLRAAWSDGPLGSVAEAVGAPSHLTVTPKPASEPPITIAGQAKPAVRRAARMGDGWLPFPSETPGGIERRLVDIHQIRDADGIDRPFTVYPGARGFVADSRADAWNAIKDGLFHMRRKYADFGFPTASAFTGADSIDDLPEETVERMKAEAVYGTPEDVIEGIEPYRQAAGDDAHFLFRVFIPGVEREPARRCLELLADEVQPHFAD